MSAPKLTAWYPGEVKPARIGWYEVEGLSSIGNFQMRWDGKEWRRPVDGGSALVQNRAWRGLSSNPGSKA